MAELFRRTEMAKHMAAQLLRPGVLDAGLRSGLFLHGIRRVGKTTFLKLDLIPAL
jgi:predicted AAA+ superfamily ATPase